ncbi:MobQ family relaxase, partial [Sulfitobacter donghicola]
MADSAIFHLDVKTIGRSQGRSSVAAAAYRAASKLHDERTGLVHDYRRKKNGIEDSYIAAPDNCGWITDRSTLWNTVEASEKRKNSTTAREWLVALPDALSDTQRADLTRALAIELVTRYKIAVDVAIHKPSRKGDQRNHHAHLLTTTREAGPEGMGAKTRILDAAKTGGVEIAEMRKWWAGMVNDALEAADSDARVDHRRKSVIVAEMKAEAEVLQQQANDIEALNVDVENPKDLVKALGKAARAIKDSGLSAATAKASDAPKLRERSKELELQAAQIAQTPLNSHDGPQLTAYKRRMAKTWKDQAKAKAALRAAEKAETAR